MSERKITKGQILSCIRYHEEMAGRFRDILAGMLCGKVASEEEVERLMKIGEAKKMTTTVKNVPPITEKYVTALPAHGSLWYYGSYETLDEANATMLENPGKNLVLLINEEVTE